MSDWWDYMNVDEWGFITLKEKTEELGYNNLDCKFFTVSRNRLIELISDIETYSLINQVVKPREVEVWILIPRFGGPSSAGLSDPLVQDLVDGNEYEMNERREYYIDLDKFVDSTMQYGGGQLQSINEVGIEGDQKDFEVNYSDDGECVNSEGDSEGEDSTWPDFKASTNIKTPTFCNGLTFGSKEEFKEAIHNYAFNNGKDLKFEKNDKLRVTVSCKHPSCPWRINCRKLSNCLSWRVLELVDRHEGCSWTFKNKMVNSSKVAKRWKNEIKSHSNWKIEEFKEKVCHDENFNISNKQAYRAMAKAKAAIQGELDDSFNKLWSYCLAIQKTNPMTSCIVKLSDLEDLVGRKRFLRMYICWEACREGYKYCRPIVGVDGCHLNGKMGGVLLTAVGVDANDGIFPLAYAIAEGETKDSWIWFLELLKRDLGITEGNEHEITFISDKQKGLIPSFHSVVPAAKHRFCVRHLNGNMKVAGFQGKAIKDALWDAARATTINSFTLALRKIKELDVKAFEWLSDKHPSEWSRSHFSFTAKCDMLVNNGCECFNSMILEARNQPLISCLEIIRKQIMIKLFKCRKQATKWNTPICPRILEKLEVNEKATAGYLGYQCGEQLFEIRGMWEDQREVDLGTMTCSCRKWDLTGIPCKHAICAIWMKNDKRLVYQFISPLYSTDTYLKAYAGCINPMSGPEEWPMTDREPPLPPLYTTKPGRPKKQRKRGAEELIKDGTRLSRSQIRLHCTKCKKAGHNARKCPQDPNVRERMVS